MARASWKGHLRLSLVSVPVQAFNAAEAAQGEIHFHQLHASCHNRIRYQKVCPVHGEVPNDEIVMGYEHTKGQYVIVDKEEREGLRGEKDLAIELEMFIEPQSIDPVYFEGRSYYLLPDGVAGQKPYAVLLEALKHEKYWALGHAAISRREQILIVRAMDNGLCVEMLHYASQVRSIEDMASDITLPTVHKEELRLASKLIEASFRKKFDLSQYQDRYTNQLRKLIDEKISGHETVGEPTEDRPPVINLMEALRKSVAKAKPRATTTKRAKPARTARRKSAG